MILPMAKNSSASAIASATASPPVSPPLDPNFTESEPGHWAERMYERHPKKRNLPLVQLWCKEAFERFDQPIERLRDIDRVHELWCQTEDWRKQNGRYAPKLDEWLADRGWSREPDLGDDDPPLRDPEEYEREKQAARDWANSQPIPGAKT